MMINSCFYTVRFHTKREDNIQIILSFITQIKLVKTIFTN